MTGSYLLASMEKMNKICFWSRASRKYDVAFNRMKNSLMKFHSDIPLIQFTEKDMEKAKKDHFVFDEKKLNTAPYFHNLLSQQYEKVIHIDSDIVVCSPLKEVFEDEYDVAVILDDDEFHKNYNFGFFATASKKFDKQLLEETDLRSMKYNSGEQGVFNDILSRGEYKVKRLDDGEGSYTTSVAYSLKEIENHDGQLYFRGKPLRMIHMVAHWGKPVKMLDFIGEVDDQVLTILNNLMS